MATPLIISEEAMKTAEKEYNEYAKEMRTLQQTLKNAVDEIKDGWNSDAGQKFFKQFEDEWYKHMSDYIAVIEHMGENMNDAIRKYAPLFEDADNIKLR